MAGAEGCRVIIKEYTMEQAEIISYEFDYNDIMCPYCFMVNSEAAIKPEMECWYCQRIYSVVKGGAGDVLCGKGGSET